MKRDENKQQFYIWDYLWWMGERMHEYHNRITGQVMLWMYANFLLLVPVIFLLALVKINHTLFHCILVVYLALMLLYAIWGEKLYGANWRNAVMKHYADRNFNPARGYLFFFMPVVFFIAMLITIVSLMDTNYLYIL